MILIHLGLEFRLDIHSVFHKRRAHFWFELVTYVPTSGGQMHHIIGRQRA